MFHRLAYALGALTVALGTMPVLIAQEKPAMVPLKLDLVISRQVGTKKISSMPYTMWVTANAPEKSTMLRMGVRVPVAMQPKESAVRSYSYENVGTNIDATATTAPDGRFGIGITLSESGVDTKAAESAAAAPMFREFTSRFYLLLRDGQSATYTSATDPVTGETLKVDITLSVLK